MSRMVRGRLPWRSILVIRQAATLNVFSICSTLCLKCVHPNLNPNPTNSSSSPRASEVSGLQTPGTPNPGPWNRAPSSVGSRFSVRRFMTGSRMGSFKRASGMDDDDQDSTLFFDRVYCANPQVGTLYKCFDKRARSFIIFMCH